MPSDKYTILVREGENWKQYLVISDEKVYVTHMVQALYGWNIGRIDFQGSADWPNMDRDTIVKWKLSNDDGRTRVADDIDLGNFREKLIARVESR